MRSMIDLTTVISSLLCSIKPLHLFFSLLVDCIQVWPCNKTLSLPAQSIDRSRPMSVGSCLHAWVCQEPSCAGTRTSLAGCPRLHLHSISSQDDVHIDGSVDLWITIHNTAALACVHPMLYRSAGVGGWLAFYYLIWTWLHARRDQCKGRGHMHGGRRGWTSPQCWPSWTVSINVCLFFTLLAR